jgi:FkbM family methyltransferase
MTIYLERAIRRGIALTETIPNVKQQARPSVSSAERANPVVHSSESLSRRIARKSLRLMRPLLAPLLLRLQFRMQTAIDTSPRISQIETAVDTIQTKLADIATMLNRLLFFHGSVPAVGQRLDKISATLDQITGALDRTSAHEDLLLQRRVVPVGNELLVRSIDGWVLVPVEDLGLVMAMVETAGILEPGTRSIMTRLLSPGSVVIDVGAHIGCLTLAAAHKVGETGHVMAIEPTPRSVELLRANVNLNDLAERIMIHTCAAGASSKRAILNLSSRLGHNSLLPLAQTTGTVEVDVHPVDSLVPVGRRVDLVKIDVEGWELEVWKGMQRVISDNHEIAIIVELGPSHLARAGTTPSDWLAELCKPGFTPWEIDETSASLYPLRPISDLEKLSSINLLLLRGHPSERTGLKLT